VQVAASALVLESMVPGRVKLLSACGTDQGSAYCT